MHRAIVRTRGQLPEACRPGESRPSTRCRLASPARAGKLRKFEGDESDARARMALAPWRRHCKMQSRNMVEGQGEWGESGPPARSGGGRGGTLPRAPQTVLIHLRSVLLPVMTTRLDASLQSWMTRRAALCDSAAPNFGHSRSTSVFLPHASSQRPRRSAGSRALCCRIVEATWRCLVKPKPRRKVRGVRSVRHQLRFRAKSGLRVEGLPRGSCNSTTPSRAMVKSFDDMEDPRLRLGVTDRRGLATITASVPILRLLPLGRSLDAGCSSF